MTEVNRDWVSEREVARRLGVSAVSAARAVRTAGVGTRLVPGMKYRQFFLPDVLRVAAEAKGDGAKATETQGAQGRGTSGGPP